MRGALGVAEMRALRSDELVLLGADTSPGLERGPVGEGLPPRATWAEAFDDKILYGTGVLALGDSTTLKLVQKSQSIADKSSERTVRCRVDPADIKPRNFPDWDYDASRDKPDAPVLDVWGEPLVLARPETPAWPSKQRIGLYLPE